MKTYNKCDVCGIEAVNVLAGRWIFYCPNHKSIDREKTYDNELAPRLNDGDFDDMDGELQELMLELAA